MHTFCYARAMRDVRGRVALVANKKNCFWRVRCSSWLFTNGKRYSSSENRSTGRIVGRGKFDVAEKLFHEKKNLEENSQKQIPSTKKKTQEKNSIKFNFTIFKLQTFQL